MSFFGNDAINRVNLHTGVMALAQSLGAVFFLAFLLAAGVSVPLTLLAQAGIIAGRFAVRPALLPLARRFGIKPLLIWGTLVSAAQYPLLAEVHGAGPMLALLCVVSALGDLAYYLAFNAYYARLGDAEHRGKQLAAREALVAAIGIAGPLAGGAALAAAGPRWTFAAAGLVQALAIIPLLGAPNVSVPQRAPGAFAAARPAALLMAADGWFDTGFVYVWQIALFVSLGRSFPAYGGAMALAGLVGAGMTVWLGRHVDAGGGRRAVLVCYGLGMGLTVLRAISVGSPWLAVAANGLAGLFLPLLGPTLGSPIYNLSKASPDTFRFAMATEGSWDVGAFAGFCCAAGVAASSVSLAVPILMALPAAALSVWVLLRLHAPAPAEAAA
jgi:MFS transporter, DHA1 family, inner membrane transport protein